MSRPPLSLPVLLCVAMVGACDSAKESRPTPKAANDSKPAKAAPADAKKPSDTDAKPTKAEPEKAEPAKAEPTAAGEPCLVTVSVEEGDKTSKPVKATVTPMPTGDDAVTSMIIAVLDGKATAPAPLSKEAVTKLGRAYGVSETSTSIEFAHSDSATYTFDGTGRMVKAEFDPTADNRYAIVQYHYECDEALVKAASAGDAGTTAPPAGTPSDWRAIEGDYAGLEASGTFFVPKTWVLEGKAPNQMARPTADSVVHCFLNKPPEHETKAELTKAAKGNAKKNAVKTNTLERDGAELYVLEYAAQGDGTQVIEAWSFAGTVPTGVTCADESGEGFKGVRKDVDLVVGSLIAFTGERG